MSDKQIKMADVFQLPVTVDYHGHIQAGYGEELIPTSPTIKPELAMSAAYAINNHDRRTAQIEAFKAFTDAMLDISWQGGDADGATIQDLALQHGLLKEVVETGPCNDERCICAEVADFPITCNRKTYLDKEVESHAS